MKQISRRFVAGVIAVCGLLLSPQAFLTETSPVANTSYETAGERVLRHEVVVDATIEEARNAFSTAEGLKSFAVPVVEFELKTGGKFHSNYQVGSKIGDAETIYNTVLSYLPRKMIAFRIGLTDSFPPGPRQAGTLFAVVEFEEIGGRKVRVGLSTVGWGAGADWETVYKHFDWGNAYTLKALHERFVNGPVDWHKRAEAASK